MTITIDHTLDAKNLGLNANEASVLAAIAKCSRLGKGWYADYAALADALEFEVSVKTVSRAVRKLIKMELVEKRQNVLFAGTNCPPAGTKCPSEGTNCPSPYNSINNNMKRNENIARDTIATPSPEDIPSFERLLKIYFRNKSRFQFDPKMEEECRQLWDAYEFWKRKMLLEQLFENREGVRKPRLDWTLADFDPQPENMKGQPLEKDVKYRTAKWKGSWGMYSQKDIDDFCLEVAPTPKPKTIVKPQND